MTATEAPDVAPLHSDSHRDGDPNGHRDGQPESHPLRTVTAQVPVPPTDPAAGLHRFDTHRGTHPGPHPGSRPTDRLAEMEALSGLTPVGLTELDGTAALQTRRDRKYLVRPEQLSDVIAALGPGHQRAPVRVLDISGHRSFPYRSTYHDTPDLICYQRAARSRPARFKVRTRTYLATGTCWLEVKVRSARGATVKDRIELPPGSERHLTRQALAFLAGHEPVAPHVADLSPVLVTTYDRTTLLCPPADPDRPDRAQRVTIDRGLACSHADGGPIGLGELEELLIVETKSPGHGPGPFDRALWANGIRPSVISKYAVGIAASQPSLPANKWHRVMQLVTR